MKFYEITDKDKELINVALNTLQNNFDDGIYHCRRGTQLSKRQNLQRRKL